MDNLEEQSKRSDAEWVDCIIRKDSVAFEFLNQQLSIWLYNYFVRRPYQWPSHYAIHEITNECVMDCLVRIMERIDRYHGRGPFLGWCRVLALNVARDHISREIKQRGGIGYGGLADAEQIPESALSIEAQVVLGEVTQLIEAIWRAELTELEREVLSILAYKQATTAELANQFGTTKNNIYRDFRFGQV